MLLVVIKCISDVDIFYSIGSSARWHLDEQSILIQEWSNEIHNGSNSQSFLPFRWT